MEFKIWDPGGRNTITPEQEEELRIATKLMLTGFQLLFDNFSESISISGYLSGYVSVMVTKMHRDPENAAAIHDRYMASAISLVEQIGELTPEIWTAMREKAQREAGRKDN